MLVSLILPSLNEGERLQQTVVSLLRHTDVPFEIIVVDNGSTDGSSQFLRGDFDKRVGLLHSEQRLGVVGARHAGAAHAKGEVFVFSDAHILYPENWLAPLLSELVDDVALVGPGLTNWGDPDGPMVAGYGWRDLGLEVWPLQPAAEAAYDVGIIGGGCHVIRRDLFEKLGGYDIGMVAWGSEDQELCLRLWSLGYRVRVVPSVRVQHYFRESVEYATWPHVNYNKLRLIFQHFCPKRVEQSFQRLANEPGFQEAFAKIESSDVWDRRCLLDEKRVRDAEWFFREFVPGVQLSRGPGSE